MHRLCGLGVSPGRVFGRPITLDQYKNSHSNLKQHLILLIEDLSFEIISEIILEGKIEGIVAERGGICSHGATLAREAKMPCVVKIGGIDHLSNYENIQIDGTSGDIEVP